MEQFLCPFVLTGKKQPTQYHLDPLPPTKAATMSTSCHDYTHPSPPIPPFIASAKPKQIASTDNMLSKLYDGYTPFISGQRFNM